MLAGLSCSYRMIELMMHACRKLCTSSARHGRHPDLSPPVTASMLVPKNDKPCSLTFSLKRFLSPAAAFVAGGQQLRKRQEQLRFWTRKILIYSSTYWFVTNYVVDLFLVSSWWNGALCCEPLKHHDDFFLKSRSALDRACNRPFSHST